ncbi:MAG: endolytic transglycosylase MltG [Parvibaculaceae bacterium]
MASRHGSIPGGRRRSPLRRVLLSLFTTLAMAGALAGCVLLYGLKVANDPGPLSAPKAVVIAEGLRTPEIATLLKQEGVIENETLFAATAYLTSAAHGSLKPGEYEFKPGQNMMDALATIRSGKSIMHKVTIPEGWTTEQALKRIEEHTALSGAIGEIPPEGALLPDTYLFSRGYPRSALVSRIRAAQTKLVDGLWEGRAPDLPVHSKEEALTLASIVEKETGIASERPQVAAVFLNRLKKRMRLQSDPTIIYGIVGGKGRLDRPIRRSDIETRTDYNTYRIDGLPPGPIANPGRASLEAVLNPTSSSALYFVADGSGGHAFANTLAEHKENVRKWRRIERDRATEEATAEAELAAEAEKEAAAPEAEKAAEPAPAEAGEDASSPETAKTESSSDEQASTSLPPTPAPADEPKKTAEQEPVLAEAPPDPAPLPIGKPGEAASEPRSGSLVRVANRLVPIPKPKPQR